jgi:hypothetical protein
VVDRTLGSIWVVALVFAATSGIDVAAQVLAQRECQTNWQGQVIRGVMQIEWLPYSQTHRIYGQFRDPPGNLIEFEVITNQPGGVGGMWFNNARHREIHIELVMLNERTFDIRGPAGTARYVCR